MKDDMPDDGEKYADRQAWLDAQIASRKKEFDLTAPYRKKEPTAIERAREEYVSYEQAKLAQRAIDRAVRQERAAKRREERRVMYGMWRATAIQYAIRFGVPLFALWLVWTYAIEPMVHYHSLSVACSAHDMYACRDLKGY